MNAKKVIAKIVKKIDKSVVFYESFIYDPSMSESVNRIRALQKLSLEQRHGNGSDKRKYEKVVIIEN